MFLNACIITGLAVGYAGLLNRLWHFDDKRIQELTDVLVAVRKDMER